MAQRAQKIALKPNKEQLELFNKHCGYARVAYNAAHSDFTAGLQNDTWHSVYELKRQFNVRKRDVFEWCDELSQNASKNAIHNFHDAVTRWQNKQNKFPKRKNRKSKDAYQADNGPGTVRVEGRHVMLPKIGKVRMCEKPRWSGEIRRAVVSRTADKWFASILVEIPDETPPDTTGLPTRGVDVGITHLATTDDGTKFENPRALAINQRKLRRLNKSLARKKFLSNNWKKVKDELSRLHARIANIRSDAHHKVANTLLEGISRLGIESLTVKGLMKNRRLSKALADAALSGLLTKLKYKAVRRGVQIVEADRFFPSSKRCSSCGHKKQFTLSDREYHCGICGFIEDRDVNAAINLKLLASSWDESLNACGESVRPTMVGKDRGSRKTSTQQIMIDFST